MFALRVALCLSLASASRVYVNHDDFLVHAERAKNLNELELAANELEADYYSDEVGKLDGAMTGFQDGEEDTEEDAAGSEPGTDLVRNEMKEDADFDEIDPDKATIGDRVRARDSEDEAWRMGTVTSVGPLRVRLDGFSGSDQWTEVQSIQDAEEIAGEEADEQAADEAAAEDVEAEADDMQDAEDDEAEAEAEEETTTPTTTEPPTTTTEATTTTTEATLTTTKARRTSRGGRARKSKKMFFESCAAGKAVRLTDAVTPDFSCSKNMNPGVVCPGWSQRYCYRDAPAERCCCAVDPDAGQDRNATANCGATWGELASDSKFKGVGFPDEKSYKTFLEVDNFNLNMHNVFLAGQKVAGHIDDKAWKSKIGSYSLTKFLHRRNSELPKHASMKRYADKPLNGTTVVVVGAGPAGLRFAIEARLMGATVHVMEYRHKYNRYNVLKLWEFTVYDLTSLGVKDLYPALTSFSVKRVPIALLQHALTRVAMAMGVTMHFDCGFTGISALADGTPQLHTGRNCPSKEDIANLRFDALYDATGSKASLRDMRYRGRAADGVITGTRDAHGEKNEGRTGLIGSHLQGGREAIGLTFNFKRFSENSGENKFYEDSKNDPRFKDVNPASKDDSNLAFQFNMKLFKEKKVQVKNWAHWKSKTSHYLVVTLPRKSFIDFGVVDKTFGPKPINEFLSAVDKKKLAEMGLTIAEEWNFPHKSNDTDAFIRNSRGGPDLSLFEYGRATRAEAASTFLPGTPADRPVYFGVLGDGLETPFWPHGTGANHAFYSAYLQAFALVAWKKHNLAEDATVKLANDMLAEMFTMNIKGNKQGYKRKDYDAWVEKGYKLMASGEAPKFE